MAPSRQRRSLLYLVLCWVERMQVRSGSDNFKKNRVGLIRVELGKANQYVLNFLMAAVTDANKSAD